jgi:hypothetical protein
VLWAGRVDGRFRKTWSLVGDSKGKETEHMHRWYDIDPCNRRYSEEELQETRERYHVKQPRAQGGSDAGEGGLSSARRVALSLLRIWFSGRK